MSFCESKYLPILPNHFWEEQIDDNMFDFYRFRSMLI